MAAFDPSAELSAELDFRLLRNTFVTMFRGPVVPQDEHEPGRPEVGAVFTRGDVAQAVVDKFAGAQASVARAVLDIFADQARGALLVGHRMMCLVQSDDPRLSFPAVGATPVSWNDAERLDSQRGL
ncbi:hypothetical protein QRX50_22315 [Amycolatopsis carbonis]|uniref:Uncharacterized protein n=1 Tax=Amycolatopsis carbonis TaxID=715471 RepID=A0A9Y2INX8_9PSEU|nr:hypothetical protein [Amycolatopsis sp. 2-15]WIX83297.1 hypothetical protein QRX50_22315 [Amycolatopsis sp. 2-15]